MKVLRKLALLAIALSLVTGVAFAASPVAQSEDVTAKVARLVEWVKDYKKARATGTGRFASVMPMDEARPLDPAIVSDLKEFEYCGISVLPEGNSDFKCWKLPLGKVEGEAFSLNGYGGGAFYTASFEGHPDSLLVLVLSDEMRDFGVMAVEVTFGTTVYIGSCMAFRSAGPAGAFFRGGFLALGMEEQSTRPSGVPVGTCRVGSITRD